VGVESSMRPPPAIALLYFRRVFFITVDRRSMIAFLLDPLVVIFMRLRLPRGWPAFSCSARAGGPVSGVGGGGGGGVVLLEGV